MPALGAPLPTSQHHGPPTHSRPSLQLQLQLQTWRAATNSPGLCNQLAGTLQPTRRDVATNSPDFATNSDSGFATNSGSGFATNSPGRCNQLAGLRNQLAGTLQPTRRPLQPALTLALQPTLALAFATNSGSGFATNSPGRCNQLWLWLCNQLAGTLQPTLALDVEF